MNPADPGNGRDDARDDWLWDRSGAPDADVERLEMLLAPLGAREDRAVAAPSRPRAGRGRLLLLALTVAAAAVVVAVALAPQREPSPAPDVAARPEGPEIRVASGDSTFDAGAWIETDATEREVLVGDLGRVRLAARSRLQVRHATEETTLLYLARGGLEAFVSADARPGFFQVDTDAARCVDLGCRYTLTVADDGEATVRVTTGQVAFRDGDRERFVPAGAVCVARRDAGPGTPRFEDARAAVRDAFDALDRAGGDGRRAAALAALETVRDARDTLPAWHLLQEADPEVVRAATARLEMVAGSCGASPDASPADLRNLWKERLFRACW